MCCFFHYLRPVLALSFPFGRTKWCPWRNAQSTEPLRGWALDFSDIFEVTKVMTCGKQNPPEKLEDVDLCNPLHYPVAVSHLPISLAPYGASQSTSSPLVLKIVTDNKRQQQSAIERQCNEWIYIPATDLKCT